jgi:hypothetical protein
MWALLSVFNYFFAIRGQIRHVNSIEAFTHADNWRIYVLPQEKHDLISFRKAIELVNTNLLAFYDFVSNRIYSAIICINQVDEANVAFRILKLWETKHMPFKTLLKVA